MKPWEMYAGPWGSIWRFPSTQESASQNVDWNATLASYFLLSRPAHPIWPHYVLAGVHLRDMPGQSKSPYLRHPDSSHELMLLALNPERGPWVDPQVVWDRLVNRLPVDPSPFLSPPNMVLQVRATRDEEFVELLNLVAHSLVDGHLPIECSDFFGGRERWEAMIPATLEHIRHDGHPSRDN